MTKLVSTLIGAELAYWAARANGDRAAISINGRCFILDGDVTSYWFKPHEDWSQAGHLIVKHTISIGKGMNQITFPGWYAMVGLQTAHGNDREKSFGPDPLVAAMRALVASVYGKEVPNEENT